MGRRFRRFDRGDVILREITCRFWGRWHERVGVLRTSSLEFRIEGILVPSVGIGDFIGGSGSLGLFFSVGIGMIHISTVEPSLCIHGTIPDRITILVFALAFEISD